MRRAPPVLFGVRRGPRRLTMEVAVEGVVHRISLFVDAIGRPVAASLTRNWESDDESTRVYEPGPFDSPGEVLDRIMTWVDEQMRLW